MTNYKEFKGLIAAPFTPMSEHGELNTGMISNYADTLINNGIKGAFVCGTTGEGVAMSKEERMEVVEEWVRCAGDKLEIIAHVGGVCRSECTELAEHAAKCGVYSLAAMSPFFFKPADVSDLIGFFEPVAAAAPDLPFYYYHIPSMTGVNFPVHEMLTDIQKRIPNFEGVKYTHSDLMDLQQCLAKDGGKFDIKYGSDETLLSGLSLGVRTAVGSTFNFMAPVYHEIIAAYEKNELQEARQYQMISVKVVDILFRYGGPVRAGKAIMELIGLDCGPCRMPIRRMEETEKAQLMKELEAIDFFSVLKNEYA